MPPDLALLSTLIGSNYPCLELIFMVPRVFEPLKFDCKLLFSDLFGGSNDNISISSGSSAGFVMNRQAEQLLDNVFSMAGESTDSN